MNNYSAKDFINDVFNPLYEGTKQTNKYHKYVYIIRLLILTKISLIFSLFLFSQLIRLNKSFSLLQRISNVFDLKWYSSANFNMKVKELIKKIAVLEKRIEYLESKVASKNSTFSRDEKWNEFRSIIRLQEKNTSKVLS